MVRFGLVSEGITDQIVLEYILAGFFSSADIIIDPLQPTRDETDRNKAASGGNWHQVFEYCKSDYFREALTNNESDYYMIIQLDTDFFWGDSVGEPYRIAVRDENGELPSAQILENTIIKLIQLIGEDFYAQYAERIIFAIAVNQLECWLLPLYATPKESKKEKNCLNTLNKALSKSKAGFTIDAKNPDYYRTCSEKYRKNKVLMSSYQHNYSFECFIRQLEERNIVIEVEEDW